MHVNNHIQFSPYAIYEAKKLDNTESAVHQKNLQLVLIENFENTENQHTLLQHSKSYHSLSKADEKKLLVSNLHKLVSLHKLLNVLCNKEENSENMSNISSHSIKKKINTKATTQKQHDIPTTTVINEFSDKNEKENYKR